MARQQEQRRPWTPEEDQRLRECKSRYGHLSWPDMAILARLERSGRSCRERWNNHLNPDINGGNFSQEEDDTIIHLQSLHGNTWAFIATHLPGRTQNAIKNRWNNLLKKRLANIPNASLPEEISEAYPEEIFEPDEHSSGGDYFVPVSASVEKEFIPTEQVTRYWSPLFEAWPELKGQ